MNIEEELQKLKSLVSDLTDQVAMTKRYSAIVEQNDDPEHPGMVRLRVSGVHSPDKTKYPTESLPWQKVILPTGSSGGVGHSINMLVNQWVEVEPANPAKSAWKVIRNIPAVISDDKDDESYGEVTEGEENKVSKETLPILSTGNLEKIATVGASAMALANSGVLEFFTGPEPELGTPDLPAGNFTIALTAIDWSTDLDKEVSKFGANLGGIEAFIKVDGNPMSPSTTLVELVSEGINNSPGNIIGLSEDGEIVHVSYENNNLYVPPLITPGEYVIKYKATEIDSDPLNSEESTITITVVDEPTPRSEVPLPKATPRAYVPVSFTDVIKDHTCYEPKATPGRYPHVNMYQGPDLGITEIKDATPADDKGEEHRVWSITHTYEKDNSESVSRMEMNEKGEMIQKSANDMYLISRKNLVEFIEGAVETTIKNYLSINAPTILLKASDGVRIEGDMEIHGNVKHVGNTTQEGWLDSTDVIHSRTDVTSNVSLNGHTHTQDADAGTDDGAPDAQQDTNSPVTTNPTAPAG